MRLVITVAALVALSAPAQAQLLHCSEDVKGSVCQAYLEGKVAGALAYKDKFGKKKADASTDFSNRALSYRAGNRFKQANQQYCQDRIPQPQVLVDGLTDAILAKEIQTEEELTLGLRGLLDCQRLSQ
ncbi:hypothetical protein [Paraferrimonas haliotis]|uniref:Uncharacterized protein n=1 Tax=Paraferrimonas haliotis TaxID=2013866 RepID=A0AA37WVF9_9GAMM|nr:hypothetical protein [Paraferrimonas haliotis]GLS82503.1 hypothetical protein GCM10007894_04800 [Paraferrimonas haliotis]